MRTFTAVVIFALAFASQAHANGGSFTINGENGIFSNVVIRKSNDSPMNCDSLEIYALIQSNKKFKGGNLISVLICKSIFKPGFSTHGASRDGFILSLFLHDAYYIPRSAESQKNQSITIDSFDDTSNGTAIHISGVGVSESNEHISYSAIIYVTENDFLTLAGKPQPQGITDEQKQQHTNNPKFKINTDAGHGFVVNQVSFRPGIPPTIIGEMHNKKGKTYHRAVFQAAFYGDSNSLIGVTSIVINNTSKGQTKAFSVPISIETEAVKEVRIQFDFGM